MPHVNASLGYLCHRLTASPKLISSVFFTIVIQLTSFPYSFFFIVFRFAWIYDSYTITILAVSLKNTESYLVRLCLANCTHNHMISRSHRLHDCSRFTTDVQQLFTILKKEGECPLCLETVNNPKTLPCLHSFCLECLDKHAGFARRQLQATIKCPVCQTSFQIPEGDSFKNLPTSYHLNRLVDVLALKDGGTQAQKCSSCDENNASSSYCFICQDKMFKN